MRVEPSASKWMSTDDEKCAGKESIYMRIQTYRHMYIYTYIHIYR